MDSLTFKLSPVKRSLLKRMDRGDVITRYVSEGGQAWHDGGNASKRLLSTGLCEELIYDGLISAWENGGGRTSFVISSKGREVSVGR